MAQVVVPFAFRRMFAVVVSVFAAVQAAVGQPAEVPLSPRDLEIRSRYLQMLERDPYQVQAFDRAYASFQENEGVAAWIETLNENADDPSRHVLLGRAYATQLATADAIRQFERARELGASDARLDALMGRVYADAGRYSDAVPLLESAAQTLNDEDMRTDAIRWLGDAHNRLGDRDAAIAAWKRLTEGGHGDDFARWELAAIYEDHRLWDEAANAYADIAARSEIDPYARCRALRAQGVACVQMDDITQAIALFEEALGLASPGNWLFNDLTQQLVAAYENLGDLEGLANYVRARIDADPASIEYRALLARVYVRQDDVPGAEAEYRAMIERAPDQVSAYLALAQLLEEAERIDDAAEVLDALIGRYPHDTDYVRRLGEVYWTAGDETNAVAAWRRVVANNATPERHAELAGWLAAHDRIDDAIAEFEAALAAKPDRAWQFDLAELHVANGDLDAARAVWNATITDANTALELGEVARIFEANELLDEAEALYERALETDPANHDVRHALALLLAREERVDEAVPHFERLMAADDSEYWQIRGERGLLNALNALGITNQKQREWEEAVRAEPESIKLKLRLARLYQSRANHLGAVAQYNACVELAPDDPVHREALANAYMRAGRYAQAAETYKALIEDQPSRARAYLRDLIGIHRRLNDRDAAERAAERVVELAPTDADARVQLAQVYLTHGKDENAFQQFRDAIRLEPAQPSFYLQYGEALTERQRFAEARDTYRRLLEETDDRATRRDCLSRLASTHTHLNSLDELAREHEAHIRATPNRLDAYADLAAVYAGAERPVDAMAVLERALELVSNREEVLHLLVNAAFDANDLRKTIAYTEQLVALDDQPDVYDLVQLGRAYADTGDMDTALKTWARIREEYPDDAKALAAEARALWTHGYTEESFARTRDALELDPFDTVLRADFARNLVEQGELDEAFDQFFLVLDYSDAELGEENARARNTFNADYRDRTVTHLIDTAQAYGRLESVIERLEHARDENPASQTARNDLMAAFNAAGRIDELIALAEASLNAQPDDTALLQKLADVLSRANRTAEAAELYLRLAEIEPSRDREIRMRAVWMYRRMDDHHDKALALSRELLEAYPTDVEVATQFAMCEGSIGDAAEAERVFKDLLNPVSPYWFDEDGISANNYAASRITIEHNWASFLESHDRTAEARRVYLDMLTRADLASGSAQPTILRVTGQGSQVGVMPDVRSVISRLMPSAGGMRAEAANKLDELGDDLETELPKLLERLPESDDAANQTRVHVQKVLAAAHLVNGNEAAAEQLLGALIADHPHDLELYNALLYLNERRYDFDAVFDVYEQARAAAPQAANQIDQAVLYLAMQEGDFARSATLLRAQMNGGGSGGSMVVGYLNQLYHLGGAKEAAPLIDAYLEQNPNSSEALMLASRIQQSKGDYHSATKLAERAWDAAGGATGNADMAVFHTLYSLYSRSGRGEAFLDELRKAVDEQPHSLLLKRRLAEFYGNSGRRDDAIALYESMIEMRPRDSATMQLLANLYSSSGRQDDAIDLYSKLLTAQPSLYRQFGNQLAQLYRQAGREEELAALEERAVQRATNAHEIISFAQRALQRNNFEQAVAFFKRAAAVEPDNPNTQAEIARAYIQANDYENARTAVDAMFNIVRRTNGGNLQPRDAQLAAAVYKQTGTLDELAALADALGASAGGDQAKVTLLSGIARYEERFDDAMQILKEASDEAGDHRYMNTIMELAQVAKRPEWAVEALEAAAKSMPQPHYWEQLSQLYFQLNENAKAVDMLQRMATTDASPHNFTNALRQMIAHNLYDEAEAFYAEHRRVFQRPHMADQVHRELLNVYMGPGRFEDAVRNDIVTPDNPRLEPVLQNFVSSRRSADERSVELLQSALANHPDNVPIIRALASLYTRSDRHEDALSYWEKLGELDPDNANDRQQHAQALQQLNRRDESAALMMAWTAARPSINRLQLSVHYLNPEKDPAAYRALRDDLLTKIDPEDRKAALALFAPLDARAGDAATASSSLRDRYEQNPNAETFRAYFEHAYEYGSLADAAALLHDFARSDAFTARGLSVRNAMSTAFRTGDAGLADTMLRELLASLSDYNLNNALYEAADTYEQFGAAWRYDAILRDQVESGSSGVLRAISEVNAQRGGGETDFAPNLSAIAKLNASDVVGYLSAIANQGDIGAVYDAILKDETLLPKDAFARAHVLARAYDHVGDMEKRDAILAPLLVQTDDWSPLNAAMMLLREFEEDERIVSVLEEWAGDDEDRLRLSGFWLTHSYTKVGRFDDAVALWEQMGRTNASQLGQTLLNAAAYSHAAQVLRHEVDEDPNRAWAYRNLADAVYLSGDEDAYRDLFRDALDRMNNPSQHDALFNVYAEFLQRHQLAEAALIAADVEQDRALSQALLRSVSNRVFSNLAEARPKIVALLPKLNTDNVQVAASVAQQLVEWEVKDEAARWFAMAAADSAVPYVQQTAVTGSVQCGRIADAIAILQSSFKDGVDPLLDASALYQHLAQAPNRDEALAFMDALYGACGDDAERDYARVQWLQACGESEAAMDLAVQLVGTTGLPSHRTMQLAQWLRDADRCGAALRALEHLMTGSYPRGPRDVATQSAWLVAWCAGEPEKALRYLADAAMASPYAARDVRKALFNLASEETVAKLGAAAAAFIAAAPDHPGIVEILHVFAELREKGLHLDVESLLAIDGVPPETVAAFRVREAVIESWTVERHDVSVEDGTAPMQASVHEYRAAADPVATVDAADLPGAFFIEALDDYGALFKGSSPVVAARTTVDASSSKTVTISLGSCHEAASVWVNGEQVFEQRRPREFNFDQNRFEAAFEPGTNEIVVQLYGQGSRAGFALAVLDE